MKSAVRFLALAMFTAAIILIVHGQCYASSVNPPGVSGFTTYNAAQ